MMPIRTGRSDSALPAAESSTPASAAPDPPVYRWYHKLSAVLVLTFCVEIGLFLIVFPWTEYWETNYFGQVLPKLHVYWYNGYLRGAVSGLGVVNLYIALVEVFRLRRFAKRD